MLFADFSAVIGQAFFCLALFLAVVIYFARKFGEANPEVKEAANRAMAAKALQLINRLFK